MLKYWLYGMGVVGIIMFFMLLIFLPLILTVVLGVGFANWFGFTGITWWAFVIIFYIVIAGLIGMGD